MLIVVDICCFYTVLIVVYIALFLNHVIVLVIGRWCCCWCSCYVADVVLLLFTVATIIFVGVFVVLYSNVFVCYGISC